MRRGKYESSRRKMTPVYWVTLFLIIMIAPFSGVRAYLSLASQPVENHLKADDQPQIDMSKQVTESGYVIAVSSKAEYAVYLRAAVVVNWKNNSTNTVLPAKDGEYSLMYDEDKWRQNSDGYIYYTDMVMNETPITVVTVNGSKEGYSLEVNVAVQSIQALGTTDTDNVPAVTKAWGIAVLTDGEHKGELDLTSP